MTGYQNVAQSERGFFSRLVTLIALYGVLGMSLAGSAIASPRPPFKCIYCCPPTGCYGYQQYDTMQTYHAGTMTTAYHGTVPGAAILRAEATAVTNFVNQQNQNGTMATLQAKVLSYIENGSFFNVSTNASQMYNIAVSFGSQVPAAALQAMFNKISTADRNTAAGAIKSQGLGPYMLNIATLLNQAAAGRKYHPFDPFHLRPINPTVTTVADGLIVTGLVIGFFCGVDEVLVAIGGGIALGGAVVNYLNDLGVFD